MKRHRISQNRPIRTRIFIYSDGETEINYFDQKKKDLKGNRSITIELVPTNVKNATGYIRYVLKHLSSKRISLEENDRVFCVFDMDTADDEDVGRAVRKMPKYMRLTVSNPDFEVWFLLHYEYCRDRLGCREPIDRFRRYESKYTKPNVEAIYPSLKEREAVAMRYAELLQSYHIESGNSLYSSAANPYTSVHEVLTYMNNHCQS